MLLSIALILMVGMALGWICKKCKLPGLLGMLATGFLQTRVGSDSNMQIHLGTLSGMG